MIIDLKSIPATVTPHFFGGEGQFVANIFKDDDNKILFGLLAPGCTLAQPLSVRAWAWSSTACRCPADPPLLPAA